MRYIEDIIKDINEYKNKSPYTIKEIKEIHLLSIELKIHCEKMIDTQCCSP